MIAILEPDDGKNWARLIINRMDYGRKYCSYSQRIAREVLRLPQPEPKPHLHLGRDGRVQRMAPELDSADEPEFA